MFKKRKIILSTLLFLTTVGCSNKYAVQFDTQPQGASLVCNGKNWGYTPIILYYNEEVKEQANLDLSDCSANWLSGAKMTYGTISIKEYPNGVTQTAQRPNVDGYEKDAQFALQVQRMKYQKAQAQAAQDLAYQQMRNANANRQQAYQLQQQNYQLQNMNNYLRYGY